METWKYRKGGIMKKYKFEQKLAEAVITGTNR